MRIEEIIKEVLEQHKIWLDSHGKEGKKAIFKKSGFNLKNVDLRNADLSGADLKNADLRKEQKEIDKLNKKQDEYEHKYC